MFSVTVIAAVAAEEVPVASLGGPREGVDTDEAGVRGVEAVAGGTVTQRAMRWLARRRVGQRVGLGVDRVQEHVHRHAFAGAHS